MTDKATIIKGSVDLNHGLDTTTPSTALVTKKGDGHGSFTKQVDDARESQSAVDAATAAGETSIATIDRSLTPDCRTDDPSTPLLNPRREVEPSHRIGESLKNFEISPDAPAQNDNWLKGHASGEASEGSGDSYLYAYLAKVVKEHSPFGPPLLRPGSVGAPSTSLCPLAPKSDQTPTSESQPGGQARYDRTYNRRPLTKPIPDYVNPFFESSGSSSVNN